MEWPDNSPYWRENHTSYGYSTFPTNDLYLQSSSSQPTVAHHWRTNPHPANQPVPVNGLNPNHLDPTTAAFPTAATGSDLPDPRAGFTQSPYFSPNFSSLLEDGDACHGGMIGQGPETIIRPESQLSRIDTPSESFPSESFQCKWEGCQYPGHFGREAELVRHLKNVHISPRNYPCSMESCDRIFNRKDNLHQHIKKCHDSDYKKS